jgi:tetraacyldisaccharide 4'-kinase
MRIVERYSKRMRIFMGRGGWSLLAPLRFVLSVFHGIYSHSIPAPPEPRASVSGPKIISVGNLEVGGGGKTPCALAIASSLSERGLRPAVVTRGYGGSATREGGGALVLPDRNGTKTDLPPGYIIWQGGDETEAVSLLGDEAILYIRAGIPLAVDRDRKRGIAAISQAAGPTHVILDDAFHRSELRKDLDILLLDAERPFGNGRLLPYGTLREPASSASRAGAVVFTRAIDTSVPGEAAGPIGDTPVFFARHMPVSLSGQGGESISIEELGGSNIVLFSGIARPWSFEKTAVGSGLDPDISFRYDDHHAYTEHDIMEMIEEAGAESVFITTEKDWAKALPHFPGGTRLLRLDMRMEISGMEDLLEPVL